MHLHFVCAGNANRSRLAEAYFRSKLKNPSFKVSSSGITANKHRLGNGPITWNAMRLLKRHHLIPFMSWRQKQTTKKILQSVDYLICMAPSHLDYCVNKLGYQGNHEVWNIPDLNEMPGFIPSTKQSLKIETNHIKLSEKAFQLIIQKVDQLITKIKLH